jgi:hypothetical protein
MRLLLDPLAALAAIRTAPAIAEMTIGPTIPHEFIRMYTNIYIYVYSVGKQTCERFVHVLIERVFITFSLCFFLCFLCYVFFTYSCRFLYVFL